MRCGVIGEFGLGDGILEVTLHGEFMPVMAGKPSGPGMWAKGGGNPSPPANPQRD